MNLIQAIIMGLIQGLTEFLPVSSSGHLVLTSSLYKYFTHKDFVSGGSEEVVFDIILHLGTLLAVFLFFKDDIIKITRAFIKACLDRNFSNSDAKIAAFILIGTFFTVIVAFPLKIVSENLINLPYIVGIFIFLTRYPDHCYPVSFPRYYSAASQLQERIIFLLISYCRLFHMPRIHPCLIRKHKNPFFNRTHQRAHASRWQIRTSH